MVNDQELIARLMQKYGITAEVVSGAPDSSEHPYHYGWTATFVRDDHKNLEGFFYTSWSQKPEASFILNTWMSEVSHVSEGYISYCNEYILDLEEERSEQLYHKSLALEQQLQAFLGDEFGELLYPSQY